MYSSEIFSISLGFNLSIFRMRGPGFEPGSSAWKAEILTTELPTPDITIFRSVLKITIDAPGRI